MNKQNTGGPAFPCDNVYTGNGEFHNSQGMTLRDYFAAKAMQGMLSDANAVDEDSGNKLSIPDDAELIASASYMMADAMLNARAS